MRSGVRLRGRLTVSVGVALMVLRLMMMMMMLLVVSLAGISAAVRRPLHLPTAVSCPPKQV